MSKNIKKFRDSEDEEYFDESLEDNDLNFEKSVRNTDKRRKQDRKEKRKEKRSFFDED